MRCLLLNFVAKRTPIDPSPSPSLFTITTKFTLVLIARSSDAPSLSLSLKLIISKIADRSGLTERCTER